MFRIVTRAIVVLLVSTLSGCGADEGIVPFKGKLVLESGNISDLAGGHVEAELEGEPLTRVSGEIQPDGSFELGSVAGGKVRRGALPGAYCARIVLPDDDRQLRQRASQVIAARFLRFKTSGLTWRVPSEEDVTWVLSRRR